MPAVVERAEDVPPSQRYNDASRQGDKYLKV
jgi:hypothetical protein